MTRTRTPSPVLIIGAGLIGVHLAEVLVVRRPYGRVVDDLSGSRIEYLRSAWSNGRFT